MKLSELKSQSQSVDVCKNDILKCILGLSDLDVTVFCALKGKNCDIVELSGKVKRDRSSVQRSVKNLITAGLLSRHGVNMKRGRKYIYSTITTEKLKEMLNFQIDELCGKLKAQVKIMN
ncbi:MAG: hypothetical protein CVT90_00135 [Candidatus Altiarchaeales archaeon HGW-Altiarchaeales-3]|nr:MAG: hypothetical protein CVT90_00135 [Candidatus Altiarchaeales archaeon HGW-Altiarchaeales-3]